MSLPARRLKVVAPESEKVPSASVLFHRHAKLVAGLAGRLLGEGSDLDDVVQDVFVVALKGLPTLRDAAAAKSWLATVTVRIARRRLRFRRMFQLLGLAAPPSLSQMVSDEASPEDRAFLMQLYRTLETVPINERLAWVLRYVEGETLEGVANLCECSLATAKRRVAAAQRVLEWQVTHE